MTTKDFEKSILALTLWQHHDKGMDVMIALGNTLFNQTKVWNKSWAQVLGGMTPTQYPDVRDPLFQHLLRKVDDIHGGGAQDLSNGALYFADPEDLATISKQQIITVCARVGGYTFYR